MRTRIKGAYNVLRGRAVAIRTTSVKRITVDTGVSVGGVILDAGQVSRDGVIHIPSEHH